MSSLFLSVLLFICLLCQQTLICSNLDGTASIIYKNQHQVFSDGESARGYVRMNGGFTIKPGATASLDTVVSVSGSIDLRETGEMQLLKDLQLDSGLTWSSGGNIKGRGHALILNDTLFIPASKVIHFSSDTILDGKGHVLDLAEHAQLFVDDNVTVTLRNLVVKNKRNNVQNPCIRCASMRSKLALDNVELTMANDVDFLQGQLYVHNDVIFSGTSAFIYHSPEASFIAPSGILKFDIGTTFSFAPTTTTDHLFQLQDRTSALYLNGCTLNTTTSGMRLTKGSLLFDNKIALNSNTGVELSTLSTLTSAAYGNGAILSAIRTIRWSPNGKFLFIAGDNPATGAGGFANIDEIRVYKFDGSSLTAVTSRPYGTSVRILELSPDGTILAVGGAGPASGGGFANTDELRLYRFDGSTLTPVDSKDYGSFVGGIAWSPDGRFLAIGGQGAGAVGGFANTDEFRVYSFDGVTLTAITSQPYGTSMREVSWSPDGKVIAIIGTGPASGGGFANTNEIRLYSFNGSTLTALTSQNYGTTVIDVDFTPDGKFLVVSGDGATATGGFANTDETRVYQFNGSSLVAVTSRDSGGVNVRTARWSGDGRFLFITGDTPVNPSGGFSNTHEFRVYRFDGSTLTPLTSQQFGDTLFDAQISPNGDVIAIGGFNPTNPSGGFSNTDELRLYSVNFIKDSSPQAYSRSIVFGNSALGSLSNLNVEVLGAAHVTINGIVNDDSV
jgi:WD40 repeat protein